MDTKRLRKNVCSGLLLLTGAVLVWRSFVAVDQTQYVLVTRFGRLVDTFVEPGLRIIPPYCSVTRFDRRLRVYDPLPSEFLTSDPKNILLDLYVCWRIRDPLLFLQGATDAAGAEIRLHDIIWAETAAEIGRRPLSQLVSDDAEDKPDQDIMAGIRDRCANEIDASFGIELVDVRLKRLNLPEQNKQSVFDRMRTERDRIARLYRAEGEEEAAKIRAEADRDRKRLLAEAQRDAEVKRAEAAGEAIRVYAQAHAKDPEFYRFLRSLETYRKVLGESSTLVLSAESDLFRYLESPFPKADANPAEGSSR